MGTITNNLIENYLRQDLKIVRCIGYHRQYNHNKDYRKAKAPLPFETGFTDTNFSSASLQDLQAHLDAGGWIGIVLPHEVVVLDVENVSATSYIEVLLKSVGINPGIHLSNNGKHYFFKCNQNIPGTSNGFTRAGVPVTFRNKNYIVVAPSNDRRWFRQLPFNDLPELPADLLPYDYKNPIHILNVLSWQVRESYRSKLLDGYEGIDQAFIAFLLECNISPDNIQNSLSLIFNCEYDERRTQLMIERTQRMIHEGIPIVGPGSFLQKVKNLDLKLIERFSKELHKFAKAEEYQQIELTTENILSSMLKWNDIPTLDITTEYLLESLIPKGAIVLLFSPGGTGKTSLTMQMSRAIGEGIPFGYLKTIKTPVYIIDFENPLSFVKTRVELIGPSNNILIWHISCDPAPARLDSDKWEAYKQFPPGLIIIDTLRAAHLSDENNSKDMAIIMAHLKELREIGFTIILLHHSPKSNDGVYKGSTAILDLADHVLGLEKIKDNNNEEFSTETIYRLSTRIKTRYEPHTIYLTFNPDIKGFEVRKDPDNQNMQIIQDILKNCKGPMKQKDLVEKIRGELDLTDKKIRNLLQRGINIFWTMEKGDKNAKIFSVSGQCGSLSDTYISDQTAKQDLTLKTGKEKQTFSNNMKTIDNIKFGSFPEGMQKTEKQPDSVFQRGFNDNVQNIVQSDPNFPIEVDDDFLPEEMFDPELEREDWKY